MMSNPGTISVYAINRTDALPEGSFLMTTSYGGCKYQGAMI